MRPVRPAGPDAAVEAAIDDLSAALDLPVLLEDDDLQPIAYSRQWGPIDTVRAESILGRSAPEAVRQALRDRGLSEVKRWARIDADPDLEMESRVCVPVRREGVIVGYVWILDPDCTVSAGQLEVAIDAAGQIASVLDTDHAKGQQDDADLLGHLWSTDSLERHEAVLECELRGGVPAELQVLCLIVAPGHVVDPLTRARQVLRRLSWGLAGSVPEGAALLLGTRDPALWSVPTDSIAGWVAERAGEGVAVGQSSAVRLDRIETAVGQARVALRIASTRWPDRRAIAWDQAGADRIIARLPGDIASDLPGDMTDFLRGEPDLAETLATFLDLAGDIQRTAAHLSLHRSGVYYRLRRIEELAGIDLSSGDDRLMAQLAIRALHLGLIAPSSRSRDRVINE